MFWTRTFWKGTAERAVKTFVQAVIAVVGVGAGMGLFDVDWGEAASVGALAAVLSVGSSIVSALSPTEGPIASPSLVRTSEPPRSDLG